MRIAGFRRESLQDGVGCNLVVVFQGCELHCKGCHNEDLWPLEEGRYSDLEEIDSMVTSVTTGITMSGGEPMLQPFEVMRLLAYASMKGLKTTLYTGMTLEELKATEYGDRILRNLTYIKVGPYVEELRSTSTGHFGSTNQKFLEVAKLTKYNIDDKVLIEFKVVSNIGGTLVLESAEERRLELLETEVLSIIDGIATVSAVIKEVHLDADGEGGTFYKMYCHDNLDLYLEETEIKEVVA